MKFYWIDDTNDREKDAILLEKAIGTKIEFIGLEGKNTNESIHELLTEIKVQPNLIILDHSLDKAISETLRKGSTVAYIIRDKWPSIPIISFTGVDIKNVDSRQKEAYENMFAASKISNYYSKVKSLAEGIQLLNTKRPKEPKDLISFLIPPANQIENISKILPDNLKFNMERSDYALNVYNWMENVFLDRPGFLYNSYWAATLTGVNLKGWEIIEPQFEDAKYKGVFENKDKPLWWKDEIIEILNSNIDEVGLPWELGRSLISGDELYSSCYCSGEDFPETVAYVDDSVNAECHPMRMKYTSLHPRYESMLFMEDLRIMDTNEN